MFTSFTPTTPPFMDPSTIPTKVQSLLPTHSLAADLSLTPSDKISDAPTDLPTARPTVKCSKENMSARDCGAKVGNQSCCAGLVCHSYQARKCAQGKMTSRNHMHTNINPL